MKKIILLLSIHLTLQSSAQNSFSSYGIPAGYTSLELSLKNALVIDNNDNKWVAFQRIGLAKFDGSTWTVFDRTNSPLPSDTVKALAVDAANNLWIGTYKGLVKFDGTNWTLFNTSNSAIPADNIVSVLTEGANVWVGTNSGAAKFNGSTWITYNTSNSGIANDTVQCFSFDPAGSIFIGTKNGLSKLNGSSWTTFSTGNSGLLKNNILSLFFYQGNLWIGTLGGGLHKCYANIIHDINMLYGTCSTSPLSAGTIYSIAKGPSGGVICAGNGYGYILLEIFPSISKMRLYSGNNNPAGAKCFLANSTATGLLFFVNSGSSARDLYSFDISKYNGFGYGYYTDFMNCLDINEVNTMILNRGDLHWDLSSAHYEVPKGSGLNSIFASSFWIGGIDQGGQLHQAAMTYRQTGEDFWPGPLDTTTGTCDSTTSYLYDRIWKVNRYKVEEFKYYFANGSVQNGTYIPDYDIISWPGNGDPAKAQAHILAPFFDMDGDGIYDPMNDGDYPLIHGDQELFCIFNDNLVGAIHGQTGGLPFGVEVHLSAYAYTCPSIADSMKELNYTTFYHYEIFNRSSIQYNQTHIGTWQDMDLGCYADDYVGCMRTKNFGFAYNGIDTDAVNCASPGYGASPPILSTTILNGPFADPNDGIDNNNNGTIDEVGEKNLMTSFLYYDNVNGVPNGNPSDAQHVYNYSTGIWGDGSPMFDCNNDTTKFSFEGRPDDPNSCAETNVGSLPGDKRFLMGCGPFTLLPGNKTEFDYGIVFSRDTNLIYGTAPYYMQAEKDVATIQNWFGANNFPSCLLLNVNVDETETENNALNIFPNPSSDLINVNYKARTTHVQFELIDITGRRTISTRQKQIDISNLPSGIYLLKVIDGDQQFSKRFIKQ